VYFGTKVTKKIILALAREGVTRLVLCSSSQLVKGYAGAPDAARRVNALSMRQMHLHGTGTFPLSRTALILTSLRGGLTALQSTSPRTSGNSFQLLSPVRRRSPTGCTRLIDERVECGSPRTKPRGFRQPGCECNAQAAPSLHLATGCRISSNPDIR